MVGRTKKGVIYFSVRYQLPDGSTKTKKVENSKWKLLKEAKQAEAEFLESTKQTTGDITVDQLYDRYKAEHGVMMKQKSLYTQNNTYQNYIKPSLGGMKVNRITNRDISQWQHKLLEKGFSNRYLAKIQEYLKTIFNFGVKHDYIDRNPFKIDILKVKDERKEEMLYWTSQEFSRFIDEVDDRTFKAFFMVLYWCGLREGEAIALKTTDIDLENGLITVNKTYDSIHKVYTTPKTHNSNRVVIMTKEVKEILQEIIKDYDRVPGYDGEAIMFGCIDTLRPTTIKRKQVEACKRSGVKVIRIHDFRHSHVSLLVNKGLNAFDIAKRLGHTVEMVNNVYSHWFLESQQNLVNILDEEADSLKKLSKRRN